MKNYLFQWIREMMMEKKNHLYFPYEKIHHSFKKHIKKTSKENYTCLYQ